MIGKIQEVTANLQTQLLCLLSHLSADRIYRDVVNAMSLILVHRLNHHLDDVGVETTTQAAVRAIYDESHTLDFLVLHLQLMVHIRSTHQEALQDMLQHILIRQHILDSYLSMMQLAGCHHLHRTRNLTGTVDAGDASLNLF